ncbi:MAG: tetratricopeptide repeat protein [Acidobacteriota bacterium]
MKHKGHIPILAFVVLLAFVACPPASAQRRPRHPEKDPQYQYEKGLVALNYGLLDEAIRYGDLAVSLDPKSYEGHNLLGNAHYKKGEFAQAAAAFEKAVELRPGLAEPHVNLALAMFETGDLGRAETELKQAEAIKPEANVSFYLAKIYFQQKKHDEALAEIQKSISLNPRNPGTYNIKGVILNELQRYPEAIGSFQAGLVMAPDDVSLQINLGLAYVNNNEPDKARPVLEKVLPNVKDVVLKTRIEDYLKSLKNL